MLVNLFLFLDFRIGLGNQSHQKVLEIIVDNENLTNIMKNYSVKD